MMLSAQAAVAADGPISQMSKLRLRESLDNLPRTQQLDAVGSEDQAPKGSQRGKTGFQLDR